MPGHEIILSSPTPRRITGHLVTDTMKNAKKTKEQALEILLDLAGLHPLELAPGVVTGFLLIPISIPEGVDFLKVKKAVRDRMRKPPAAEPKKG